MNQYQKIILIAGAIALLIVFGKSLSKIGLAAMALAGKGIIIAVVVLVIFFILGARRYVAK
jgi:hypothetical protein